MTRGSRWLVLIAASAVLAVLGGIAVWHSAERSARRDRPQAHDPHVAVGEVSLAADADAPRRVVFRNMAWGPHRDELVSVPAGRPASRRAASGVRCLRFHAAHGTGICLQAGSAPQGHRAVVLDARLREQRSYSLPGIPTRARVSPSGRMVAWTAFVTGDTYAGANFSTRTAILDTRSWNLHARLEDYRIIKDGSSYRAADVNFWGVTFADDHHFYATLATGGRTYLVRGDAANRTVRTLRENVECPSLSPDGSRLVFKKRVTAPAGAPWRLYALDLRTLRETPLAERRSIDDQVVWSDAHTVAYSVPGDDGSDLWTVAADGTGTPRRLMRSALAPAYVG
ncbi:WD40 repeat protein [Streptomyces sp. SLBN-118]|uniref:TolB family protein n=1 Tax=Streptomyces sp. SLBN-118 TaxID=2768454 RepID=UPI001150099C|nr:PD40 domain-containing protein [Streptomyces sp. SLBN-118]TQK44147.1 WD40 repeat protein [Streptomyces sp. SLBN-118]